jgi:Polyferredoxin
MSGKRRLFITVLLLVLPMMLFAQEHGNLKEGRSFFDLLLSVKYIAVFAFAVISILLLWTGKFSGNVRTVIISSAFLIFGVLPLFAGYLFITPSPVCAVTKPFLFGLKPQFLATLTVIGIMSVVSGKGFCSTACPVGGLQEVLYKIPGIKKFKIPFRISNSIRIGLFVLFLVVAVTLKTSSYYFYNLFDLIHWNFDMPIFDLIEFIVFLVLILAASAIVFKPFCYMICPMGLLTWVLEHFAFLKVRLNKEKCNNCGVCEKKSPCPSVSSIVDGKSIRGDVTYAEFV